ncbi:MAG: acyl-CoA dehydrogenase family protein [Desulfobacteraceae bacterium]|nr:MAG: acyl-CoA dehydrogenase family protein [Desulfobacteraceae bacterium]
MDFEFSKDEVRIIEEVRAFLKEEITPELLAETREFEGICGRPEGKKFIKKFAARGWLTPNWPDEYGGLNSSEMVCSMIRDELSYAGAPFRFVGPYMAGPTILRFGNEEMKKEFLLPIARGELEFALGYTEPQAGSDLMGLAMRAEDRGDHFVVNGQKTFNTHCHVADYHWLAVRTDPNAPKKHKGISIIIADLKSPGITIRPMITMAGMRTNEVFYDDVIVPKKNLVGEKNKGTYYLMKALSFERFYRFGNFRRLFEEIVAYTKETMINGRPLSKDPLIRQELAQMAIELEVAKLLYYQLPYMLDKGVIPSYQSSMQKAFASEMNQRVANMGMKILGLYGQLKEGSKWAPLAGKVEHYYRMSVAETIWAGTSEIQRNIIAQRGLGLPRR